MRQIIIAIKVKVKAVLANASFDIEIRYLSLALHNFILTLQVPLETKKIPFEIFKEIYLKKLLDVYIGQRRIQVTGPLALW
jgi:hypothetical protein